jgi:hypothetical protein
MFSRVFLLAAAAANIASVAPQEISNAHELLQRDYSDTVCDPATKSANDTVPPCVEITSIEEACQPNGTSALALVAHQQCMCGGSYFSDWIGCQDCLFFHGLRSQRDVAFYESVMTAASSSLCGAATPPAAWQAVFSSVANTFTSPTTGATVSTDQAVSQTAVSLYWTASGAQGPGAITGSATLATANSSTKTVVSTSATTSGSGSGSGSGSSASTTANGGSTATGSSSTTSSTAKSDSVSLRPDMGLFMLGTTLILGCLAAL